MTSFIAKIHIKTQRIQAENGQFISVLFIIPITVDGYGHRFEIYMLVSEIHENVDLVIGIKNIFELEGIVSSWDCCFSFLNQSIPFFPKEHIVLKHKEQKLIKVEAPFLDKISGLAIIKIIDKNIQNTVMLKLKFMWNLASLAITNSSLDTVIFDPSRKARNIRS